MPWEGRARALRFINLGNHCHGRGSRCAVLWIEGCESLKTATVLTPCSCCGFLHLTVSHRAGPIAHSSESKTSIHPVPRYVSRVQSPTARNRRPPYIQCPDMCRGSSLDYRACTLLLLPLGRRQSVTRLSTTSRFPPRLSLPSLLPSVARHSWLCVCPPV